MALSESVFEELRHSVPVKEETPLAFDLGSVRLFKDSSELMFKQDYVDYREMEHLVEVIKAAEIAAKDDLLRDLGEVRKRLDILFEDNRLQGSYLVKACTYALHTREVEADFSGRLLAIYDSLLSIITNVSRSWSADDVMMLLTRYAGLIEGWECQEHITPVDVKELVDEAIKQRKWHVVRHAADDEIYTLEMEAYDLEQVYDILLRSWVQHSEAQDLLGRAVPALSKEAKHFSLYGALERVSNRHDTHIKRVVSYRVMKRRLRLISVEDWNDQPDRMHNDVLALVLAAAAEAKQRKYRKD